VGGGVGLSVHAPFRIATEKTLFGMPETKIGLFPDVGGSFFLPRLDGYLGTYLALTSESLKGLDTLFAGIATHYVPSDRLPALEERLAELDSSDPDVVNLAIEDYVAEIPEDYEFSLQKYKTVIDQCFRHDDVRLIFKELEKVIESNTEHSAWAQRTLDGLKQRSPTSLVVSLEQIRRGKTMKIDQIFRMELRIVSEFLVSYYKYCNYIQILTKINFYRKTTISMKELTPS
jgi:3-hydroxyisobutyryl-CoA hydrolase